MANHALNPAATAMAVLIQPVVAARASGGGLSETAEGNMLLSATWGLGSAIAQGEDGHGAQEQELVDDAAPVRGVPELRGIRELGH